MKQHDPPVKKEKALLPKHILFLLESSKGNEFLEASADLIAAGYTYGCRSCEYLRVYGERKTKLLRLRDITFSRDDEILPHDDPWLFTADTVTVEFQEQKSGRKQQPISFDRSDHPELNHVTRWANLVSRIRAYPGATDETTVNAYYCTVSNTWSYFDDAHVISRIRSSAKAMGKRALGYEPHEIGTHSCRSGFAMCMYLNGVRELTLQALGRWNSDAYLGYIQEQVVQFYSGVGRQMFRNTNWKHAVRK